MVYKRKLLNFIFLLIIVIKYIPLITSFHKRIEWNCPQAYIYCILPGLSEHPHDIKIFIYTTQDFGYY